MGVTGPWLRAKGHPVTDGNNKKTERRCQSQSAVRSAGIVSRPVDMQPASSQIPAFEKEGDMKTYAMPMVPGPVRVPEMITNEAALLQESSRSE